MFEQDALAYGFDALEPYIDTLTMETHYGKHHKTYTTNFNAAVEKAGLEGKTVEEILGSLDEVSDTATRNALRNNGGGFYNHNLYFGIMSPEPAETPTGALAEAIERDFGGVDALKEQLTALAVGQFGSGWAWLSTDADGKLVATNSANQDNPISLGEGTTPILGIDVWEHAYYLKHKNVRPDYVADFFKVLDWDKVAERYEAATQ
ncbi:MAG: superoxide dismutase [Atopobiaceae bacterium]|nr:superoxide dismutase [Atopobiaceae bacterium]